MIREIVDRWDAASTVAAACADEILAFVSGSPASRSLPTPRRGNDPSTVFDQVSGLPIVDTTSLCIHWNGRTCYLGYTYPFRLMEMLARHPNRYITREQLLDEVWGGHRSDAAIRSVVRELRKRLREAGMGDLAEAIDGTNNGRYGLMLDPLLQKIPLRSHAKLSRRRTATCQNRPD